MPSACETIGRRILCGSPCHLDRHSNQGSFNLIHLETMSKVDVFVSGAVPSANLNYPVAQKTVGQVSPLELYFASAEDTVLAKLDWYAEVARFPTGNGVICSGSRVQAGALDKVWRNSGQMSLAWPTCWAGRSTRPV
jgi:hypothetical protein